MPSTLYAVAALLPAAVLGSGLAIPEDNRMVQEDGLIRYPLIPQQGGPLFGRHSNITKRQIGTDILSQRSGTMYTINLLLGTPGQTVPVVFDTGSSELWVNPVCAKSTTPAFCNAQPRFTQSSTLVDLDQKGYVKYGTGYADFEYVHDYVSIGSAKITQQIFGIAQDSAHAVVGIMGAGPDTEGWENGYPLIIDSLAKQGLTKSRAFGLDLRGFDSARGSVIFGGIDTKKYKGKLVKRPIIPAAQSPDGATRYWIYLNGISVNQPDGKAVEVYSTPAGGSGQPMLLDSGYTLSALPSPIFDKLVAAFPSAVYDPSAKMYTVDCADPGKGGSLDFTFGDTVINARYYDFVWHLPDSEICVLGAFEDDFPVLGDTFLRSAYAVYDWDNKNIWLAQSADCGSNLVPIGKGPNAVPDVPGECGQPPATSTTSSSTAPPSTSTTPSTKTSTTSSKSTSTSSTSVSTVTGSSTTASRNTTASSTSSSSSTVSGSSSSPSSTAATTPPATVTRSTITYTTHTTKTITSCPPTVTHCPGGHVTVTTEIITATTAVCPETTGTYTFTRTVTESGSTKPATYTVTVSPAPSQSTPAVVPGCTPGAPTVCPSCPPGGGPAPTTHTGGLTTLTASRPTAAAATTSKYPGGKNGTSTTVGVKPTQSVVIAGAGRLGLASGLVGVAVGGVVMAVMGL